MRTCLFIIFFAFAIVGNSQSSSDIQIFENAIRGLDEPDKIIYIDSALKFYTTIGAIQKRGNIEGYFNRQKKTLQFRKKEIRFLDNEFKNDSLFIWPENIFQSSVRTSWDSTIQIQKVLANEKRTSKDKRYFHFSRVIYFRNQSFAVFRMAEMYAASAGYDFLFFYQKVGNEWQPIMRMSMGAW